MRELENAVPMNSVSQVKFEQGFPSVRWEVAYTNASADSTALVRIFSAAASSK